MLPLFGSGDSSFDCRAREVGHASVKAMVADISRHLRIGLEVGFDEIARQLVESIGVFRRGRVIGRGAMLLLI